MVFYLKVGSLHPWALVELQDSCSYDCSLTTIVTFVILGTV